MSHHAADLRGQVALVTGSSRGIGRAIAIAMAEAGADIVVHCRESRIEAEQVAASIRASGQRALTVLANVRCDNEVATLMETIMAGFGHLDILVNNAGYALGKPFLENREQEWVVQIDTLAGGYFRCCQAALLKMAVRGSGVILNIASTCGERGSAGEVAYAAANGAIIALTRSLAAEFGPTGIRVNTLLVAWASNAFDPNNPAHTVCLPQFALRRVPDVSEIANAAVYLCSAAASGITGATLPVDAGYLCN